MRVRIREVNLLNRIMVLAGTRDARDIIEKLAGSGIEVLATVTTSFGRELLESCHGIRINEGRLGAAEMACLIRENGIACVIDASHPFAKEASMNAILASNETGALYLRFERQNTVVEESGVIRVKTFEEAAEAANGIKGNILLTTGSNNINLFAKKVVNYKKRLFARVLPDSRVVVKCEKAGLTPGNIIAMKGPFSEELNIEILKYCQAAVLVAKESGETGGTYEKLRAAKKLGIPVILVERPELVYGKKVSTVAGVLDFVTERIKIDEKADTHRNQGEQACADPEPMGCR